MTEPKQALRVGILLDSWTVPAWTHRLLAILKESDYAQVILVVLNGGATKTSGFPSRRAKTWHHLLFDVYMRLEKALCHPRPDACEPRNAAGLLGQADVLTVVPDASSPDGQERFAPADVEALRARDLDVLIPLGFQHPSAEIRSTARHGAWALRHFDVDAARSTMAGVWEVFRRNPVTGAALQILDDTVFDGRTIARTYFATSRYSAIGNRNKCFWKALPLIPRKLKELHALGGPAFLARADRKNPPLRLDDRPLSDLPNNLPFLRLLLGHLWDVSKGVLRETLTREEWFLIFRLGKGLTTEFHRFRVQLRAPRGRFYADPHIVERDGKYFLFFESAPYGCAVGGRIEMVEVDRDGRHTEPETVLEQPYHLAYPAIYFWKGATYMIPDSGVHRSVDAYRCDEFPRRWSFHKTLMADIRGVDPTLFEHGGRWWMFLSVIEHEGGAYSDELFLYHADHPLSDRWEPHPMNPIVSDARKARPAGPVLRRHGRLFRLSQDGTRGYGYGINLHEIAVLTPTEYEEKDVQSIEPLWDPAIIGLHTLSHVGDLTVIDAKTLRFRPFA